MRTVSDNQGILIKASASSHYGDDTLDYIGPSVGRVVGRVMLYALVSGCAAPTAGQLALLAAGNVLNLSQVQMLAVGATTSGVLILGAGVLCTAVLIRLFRP